MILEGDALKAAARAVLDADDRRIEPVAVPMSWGGLWYVRSLSAFERDAFNAECEILRLRAKDAGDPDWQAAGQRNIRGRLLVRCVCSKDGTLLFDPKNPDDAMKLGQRRTAVLDRLHLKAEELAALSPKDIEALLGKSEGTQSDSASSTSQPPSGSPTPTT